MKLAISVQPVEVRISTVETTHIGEERLEPGSSMWALGRIGKFVFGFTSSNAKEHGHLEQNQNMKQEQSSG